MDNMFILAQAGSNNELTGKPVGKTENTTEVPSKPELPADGQTPPQGIGMSQLIFLGLMIVVMYFLLFRGPRKKQQEHKQMVQSLKKNDKVRTIGGIYGTIVDIKDDEITLKVDEANNTKIKVSASAIGKTLSNE